VATLIGGWELAALPNSEVNANGTMPISMLAAGEPGAPGVPGAPGGPVGIWPALKSMRRSERFATLAELTAFRPMSERFTWPLAMCFERTLFLVSEIAATDVPPSAMKTATVAMTFA